MSDEHVSDEDTNISNWVLYALCKLGFNSLAPALYCLLESDSLNNKNRPQTLLALMRHEKDCKIFVMDLEVCDEISDYALQVTTKEMD